MIVLKSKTLNILGCFINKIVHESFLSKFDKICIDCEKSNNNRLILNEKASKLLKIENEEEKMVRIYDFLNELDGYDYLCKNKHRNIEFIKKGNKKTPDFKSENVSEQVVYTEVKTIRLGKDEEGVLIQSYFSKSGPNQINKRGINKNWATGLKKKVKDAIENAEVQFKSANAKNKILLIFYTIGEDYIYTNTRFGKSVNQITLDDIFGQKFFDYFESKYDMKIIRLPVR